MSVYDTIYCLLTVHRNLGRICKKGATDSPLIKPDLECQPIRNQVTKFCVISKNGRLNAAKTGTTSCINTKVKQNKSLKRQNKCTVY